ncbi:Uma2 family endonuclease [Chloroflexus sp.]|uniref:Uma2 family endonuclease n=1 Tax=Chloroflexus sp. TaxID=1904827 RepID=UPI00298F103A|nr:Uma2 family endonuclease [Chloroflexus sp.]MCS6888657.1 Uma2 family endonuclease [Chloroflexus sp.]MDW8405847.1 Uma2 family endonuclease [Chloroflexus sp.]
MTSQPVAATPIVYPDSDGMPMADNTKQFRAIVTIQGNLDALFRERADVFVAGDLLWYPVEGRPDIRRAPDVMVVFGRPKGDRGSYRQWEEDNIAPQVVFEVLSPNNTLTEMAAKLEFYDIYGVEEYYLYDPDTGDMSGWQRIDNRLRVISELDGWVSPRLGIIFGRTADGMQMYWPDGRPFVSFVELQAQAEQERQRAEQERQRAERLAERLRALGVDPE